MIVIRAALVIGMLLLLAPGASATTALEWPAATLAGPILVEMKDGRTFVAVGPVRGDERMLLLRLADDALVSVAADGVERITAAPADATSIEESSDADAPEPRVYGNADLPPVPDSASASPPEQKAAEDGSPAAALTYDGYRDRNGRDEKWWRDRVSRLNEELEATQQEIDRLEREYRVAKARTGAPLPRGSAGRKMTVLPLGLANRRTSSLEAGKVAELEEASTRLEEARARRDTLKAEIDGLSEEARRAGALPGWLR